MRSFRLSLVCSLALAAAAACGSPLVGCSSSSEPAPKTDAEYKAEVVAGMHAAVKTELATLLAAARDLQAAAPTPTGRGWDATLDAAAIAKMKDAWRRCRIAYEHVEGVVAPIFPDVDFEIDARYDDFLVKLAGKGDANPFDDQGVTGMHGIERILWSDAVPAAVIDFEKTLPGYAAPAFPKTAAEALDFKNELVGRLIRDLEKLDSTWAPAQIDIGVAFQGLVSLMNEQREKVNKAATGEEESRYAQMTLFDLRNNLQGTQAIYAIFRPWVRSKSNADKAKDGPTLDDALTAKMTALGALYGNYTGDALPTVPTTWSSDTPTAADLATPFGTIFVGVRDAVDPTKTGSIVEDMNALADLLGFPQFRVGA
jgi:iron uptake system component EfeO